MDIFTSKVYTNIYIGVFMRTGNSKELYSLAIDIVDKLVVYAKKTNQKKRHIVAEVITEYIKKCEQKEFIEDALSLIGVLKTDKPTPDIQEIKANRYRL